ncbi:MAG: BatA and WFA domain-containing protein [Pirellulales bacterium]|nr:BatA and WFA domain-containing protein [Pirellulales bacterium]
MDFISSLAIWQWLIVLAVPPAVVALYFLKLRRQPLEVPSTYLWKKSIEDLHVNSLWQRIRQNLLLYLQLLVLGLIILALFRPGWRSQNLKNKRHIFLLDHSASMNASDVAPSRLLEAKRQALAMIDAMGSGDSGMVVSFSDIARVEQGFTENKRDLHRAVANIKASNRPTALDEALRTVVGMSKSGREPGNLAGRVGSSADEDQKPEAPPTTLYILSDGKFPPVQGLSLRTLEPKFIPIGHSNAINLSIVAFGVRRNEQHEGRWQAFGSVQNFGEEAVTTHVELSHNGNKIDASQVTVQPGDTAGVAFDLTEGESGILEMQITHDDVLHEDNRAWVAVNSSRKPKVLLVTDGNEALEMALATSRARELAETTTAKPEVLNTKEHQQAASSGSYDLIIFDRCRPIRSPRANTVYIGALPPSPLDEATEITANAKSLNDSEKSARGADTPIPERWWSFGPRLENPQVIDLNRSHPLMQWLDMGDVELIEGRLVLVPPGGTTLLESTQGPILAIAPRAGFEDVVMGFEINGVNQDGNRSVNTNWPIRSSFPSFIFAALSYLGGNNGAAAGASVKPGQPLMLKSELPVDQLEVHTPQGARLTAHRGKAGSFQFSSTEALGPYEIYEGSKVIERFTVNLFDPLESSIRPAKDGSIQIGIETVQGTVGYEPVRRETWKWLLLAGLVVLLLEWYIYHRRVYV